MSRTTILYGVALALLVLMLKFFEYRFFVRDFSLEFYIAVIALMFTILGVWTGVRLSRRKPLTRPPIEVDETYLRELGISRREQEVLGLMSEGLSNQEIADKLFVSLHTVKTHSSNIFQKLNVKRRTQAIQKGKSLRIIQ